ncbi:MAG: glycoside hydrolase family 15 protein [Pyrinomonadaceae bacterium]
MGFSQTLAPGGPGNDAQWATAGKQGVGTSVGLESKVWFTLADGVLTEVYYPNVAVANVQLLQFVVVNKKTGKVETEKEDTVKEVNLLDEKSLPVMSVLSNQPTSPAYYQTNWAKDKKWRIRKKYITDPVRNTVLIEVEFSQNLDSEDDYDVYVYYDPSLNNSGLYDTAWSDKGNLLASDGDKVSSLSSAFGFSLITNGFLGTSDGLTQLKTKKKLDIYEKAENGNVVQFAKLKFFVGETDSGRVHYRDTLGLGFGKTPIEATQASTTSLKKDFLKTFSEYQQGWSDYLKTLPKINPKYQAQFNMAAMVLKAHEDKTDRGANIASLTVPWGGGANANEDNVGGYHLVWSRDLYQVATAFMALGDRDGANRALDFVFNVQQKPDGSFPQNSRLDGTPFWESLQLDEVAFPLILAYQLGRFDKKTWENHVKKAADFIVKNGPATPQERWEEEGGYSPSTIAAEIAGLVCAADIARRNGDDKSAELYLKTADEWEANIEKWTATTTGKYGDGQYYLRITKNGKPDSGDKLELNNGAGEFDERDIVDAGFLELVRLGIKAPDDPLIQKSVRVIDQVIKVETPNGPGFYRYNHDGYGEMDDGRRWNWDGKYTGKGRLWALLSGERGEYELALYNYVHEKFLRENKNNLPRKLTTGESIIFGNKISAGERLDHMMGFANEGLMIPEQIWDKKETPANIDRQFVPELKFGEGTGSATPLAWSMAQFIRLAVNLKEERNLETPDIVYQRYVWNKENIPLNGDFPGLAKSIFDIKCWEPKFWKDCSYVTTFEENIAQTPILRNCHLGGFYIACKNPSNEMHACFSYTGKFKTLEIAGDFTDWKPQNLNVVKKTSKYSAPCFNFSKNARVEYKLIVDGQWITDPLNPKKIDNGVGGENSVLEMPEYKPTVWDREIPASPLDPKIAELEIDSKKYGQRKVKIYVPSEFYKRGVAPKLPVLYLQDGSDYIKRAKAITILENLIAAKKVEPFMIVFIDPVDRMKEYWANDDFADFVALEIVPAVEKKYFSVVKTGRENRALLGASLGGITSVWIGLRHPDKFARIGGQSSSFWVDDKRVVKELEKLDPAKNRFTFYFDDGILEEVDDTWEVAEILEKKGFKVTFAVAETGHNWTSWRDRLADAFLGLWG